VKKMSVKAPMDGIVVMQSIVRNGEFGQIREGDGVSADSRSCRSWTQFDGAQPTVNQVDAEKLRLNMKATIHMDAYPTSNCRRRWWASGDGQDDTFRAAMWVKSRFASSLTGPMRGHTDLTEARRSF